MTLLLDRRTVRINATQVMILVIRRTYEQSSAAAVRRVDSRILCLRDQKIILDSDLAELCGFPRNSVEAVGESAITALNSLASKR